MNGVLIEPDGDVATPLEALLVLSPVLRLVCGLIRQMHEAGFVRWHEPRRVPKLGRRRSDIWRQVPLAGRRSQCKSRTPTVWWHGTIAWFHSLSWAIEHGSGWSLSSLHETETVWPPALRQR